MPRVAIVGANGQVGAELCLLLAARRGIELVPICRTRSGSAFLRWHGIPCRHGRVADESDASRLLADCDFVVNSSLASGTPAEIRGIEDQIVRNIFAHSKGSATIIHFSTQSVYGDPRPYRLIRWRNPYGQAKLGTEAQVRARSRETKKPAFILRLGHVCGALQEITLSIRDSILSDAVLLPHDDHSSNTVYTGAIIQALDQIIRAAVPPGTYDLMNTPAWTWRDVYQYEAENLGVPLAARRNGPEHRRSRFAAIANQLAATIAANQSVRDMFAKAFPRVPADLNARAMAWWYSRRARSEIAALTVAPAAPSHLSWVANGVRFFPADHPTIDVLRSISIPGDVPPTNRWPDDFPDAGASFAAPTATAASVAGA
jgi:nucleoside-diphosphate-sugar epimerase